MNIKLFLTELIITMLIVSACSNPETYSCGFDDGPFTAIPSDSIAKASDSKVFELKNDGVLCIDNRIDTLPPVISFYEEELLKWSVVMDLENWRIDSIYSIEVSKDKALIKLEFIASWSFGNEFGSMRIDRYSGDNSFCLSW